MMMVSLLSLLALVSLVTMMVTMMTICACVVVTAVITSSRYLFFLHTHMYVSELLYRASLDTGRAMDVATLIPPGRLSREGNNSNIYKVFFEITRITQIFAIDAMPTMPCNANANAISH